MQVLKCTLVTKKVKPLTVPFSAPTTFSNVYMLNKGACLYTYKVPLTEVVRIQTHVL